MKKITKKEFKERCSFHVYGSGHRRTNVIFYGYEHETRTYKYALAAQVRTIRKDDLFKALYAWVTNYSDVRDPSTILSVSFGFKYAHTDLERFKVPIALTGFRTGRLSFFKEEIVSKDFPPAN